MNSFVRNLTTFSLGAMLSIGMAQAANDNLRAPLQLAASGYPNGSNNNPDNGAIRRANPNSRQGTESISPPVRGPMSPTQTRPPTLENGGIRNGFPTPPQVPPRPANSNDRPAN